MKLTVVGDRVRIDIENGDVINTEGDAVRTTAIEFGWRDFDDLVWQYTYGRETDKAGTKLPPRRCDNCRSAIIEKRIDGCVRCSKDRSHKLMAGDNGCDDHLYRKELLD